MKDKMNDALDMLDTLNEATIKGTSKLRAFTWEPVYDVKIGEKHFELTPKEIAVVLGHKKREGVLDLIQER